MTSRQLACVGFAASSVGTGLFDSPLLLLDFASLDLPLFVQCFACLGSLLPTLDLCKVDSPLPLQAASYSGLLLFVIACSRVGLSALASDPLHLDLSLPTKSFSWLDLPPTVLGSTSLSFFLLLRGFVYLSSSLLALRNVKLGIFISASDWACLDSPSSTHGFAHFELAAAVLNHQNPDLALLLKGLGRTGFAISAFGLHWLELPVFVPSLLHSGSFLLLRGPTCPEIPSLVPNFVHIGLSLLLQSPSRLDSLMFVLDLCDTESLLPVRSLSCPDLSLLVTGLICFEFVSSLLVIDAARFELALSPHSPSWPELFLSVLSSGSADPLLLTKGFSWLGVALLLSGSMRADSLFALLVMDVSHSGAFLSMQSFAKADLAAFVLDPACAGTSMPTQCPQRPDSLMLICGSVHSGLSLAVLDFAHLDFLLPIRCMARCDLAPSLNGLVRIEFPTFPLSSALLDPLPSPRALACLELALTALDFAAAGSMLPVQSYTQPGTLLLIMGLTWTGFVSLLPVLDFSTLGPTLFVQSLARFESPALVPDSTCLDVSLFLKGVSTPELPPFVSGLSCPEPISLLLVLDLADFGLATSLHSSSRSGLAAPAFDFNHLGLSTLPQSIVYFGASVSSLSSCVLGLSLPVADFAQLDVLVSSRSLACMGSMTFTCQHSRLGLSTLASDSSQSGVSSVLQGVFYLGCLMFVSRHAHLDILLFALDAASLDLALLLRSFQRLEIALPPFSVTCSSASPFAFDFSHPELPPVLRNCAFSDSALPASGTVWTDPTIFAGDFAILDFSAPLKSPSCPGLLFSLVCRGFSEPFLLPLDPLHPESVMPLQSWCRPGTFLTASRATRSSSCLPVPDNAHVASSLPLHSSS